MQLIQPKETIRIQKQPRTTSQASAPPSGKALGSVGPSDGTFSISEPPACGEPARGEVGVSFLPLCSPVKAASFS